MIRYFEAIPFNPHIHKNQKDSLELFGHNNAKWFDKFGNDYFTREIFDAFYPGYGASWPSYYGAMRYATHPDVNLLSTRREEAVKKHRPETAKKKTNTVQGSLLTSMDSFVEATSPIKESPDAVSGVLAHGQVDKEHWLSAGLADQLNILVTGRDIYQPIRLDKGRNIVRFKGPDDLLVRGYLWEENRKQLAYKPFVVVQPTGRGCGWLYQ